MRISLVLPIAVLATLSLPAIGQDVLQPLRHLVEGLTPAEPAKPKPPIQQSAPMPEARPAPEVSTVKLPRPRPEPAAEAEPEADKAPAEARIFQTACPALLTGQVQAEALPPISDGQCTAQSPLSLTGVLVNGRMVPLSTAATLDCAMATALPGWVSAVDAYLTAHDNTGIASVAIGTSYMCRNVNNAEAGNLSFHGFADAVDVTGFTLQDGRSVTVEQGWTGTAAQGSAIMRYAHDAACGQFTTVLGPEANALHHDHLHLDLGCHGKSCTARICQ
jgi:hypothetical protein